jgi:hypothetical protein
MSFGRIYSASGADAVKKKLMAGHAKTSRELWLELWNTSCKFIEFPARIALKMVVVFLPSHLVPR